MNVVSTHVRLQLATTPEVQVDLSGRTICHHEVNGRFFIQAQQKRKNWTQSNKKHTSAQSWTCTEMSLSQKICIFLQNNRQFVPFIQKWLKNISLLKHLWVTLCPESLTKLFATVNWERYFQKTSISLVPHYFYYFQNKIFRVKNKKREGPAAKENTGSNIFGIQIHTNNH